MEHTTPVKKCFVAKEAGWLAVGKLEETRDREKAFANVGSHRDESPPPSL